MRHPSFGTPSIAACTPGGMRPGAEARSDFRPSYARVLRTVCKRQALALIPMDAVRVAVEALLLIFGLQWLRKAILRASGHTALRDEEAIYQRELAASRLAQGGTRSPPVSRKTQTGRAAYDRARGRP